jgi:hypothetical protein
VATPSKTDVSVGELFAIDVRVTGPAGASFTFPSEAVHEDSSCTRRPRATTPLPPGNASLSPPKCSRSVRRTSRRSRSRYKLSDGTGGEVRTDSLTMRVSSLLPKEESEQKLADVRGPVALPIGRAFWIAVGSLAVLIAGAIAWLVMRKRGVVPATVTVVKTWRPTRRRAAPSMRWRPPTVSRAVSTASYYIDLTMIAKRYLERRLAAPIVEMTTRDAVLSQGDQRSAGAGADRA